MDAVIFQKVAALKKEVAALCSALRTAYASYKAKQSSVGEYAQGTLSKAQGTNVAKSIVKSIQRGSIVDAEAGNTATINSVDVSKSILLCDHIYRGFGSTALKFTVEGVTACPMRLTDATTLTVGVACMCINWQVIEFY